jgi:hypothetical protein
LQTEQILGRLVIATPLEGLFEHPGTARTDIARQVHRDRSVEEGERSKQLLGSAVGDAGRGE